MAATGENFPELVALMERLLAPPPDGCPWDREQTLETLKPFLIEEAYEVLEAVDAGHPAEHCDELGDLLFQIVFQAALRAREQAFHINDVVDAIVTKMKRRHPHVFGEVSVKDSNEVLANWEKLKAAERAERGVERGTLDGIPAGLPALLRAQRVGEKAATIGFDWPDVAGVRDKVAEELAEVDEAIAKEDRAAIEHEIGDLLFAISRLSTKLGVAPEDALRGAIHRFTGRFKSMERRARADGRGLETLDLAGLEKLWQEAKRAESSVLKK
jgi:MazG family protein